MTVRKRKSVAPELIAAVLTHADLQSSDPAAALHFGVTERSVRRWRSQMLAGELPDVARLVRQKKAEALEKHADQLDRVFSKFLTAIEMRLEDPEADNSLRGLIGGAKVTGELRIQRDMLAEDVNGKPAGSDSARPGATEATGPHPGGTGGASATPSTTGVH